MTRTKVADQLFSLKQWFAGGAQSRGLRKPGCGHCYLRFFHTISGFGRHLVLAQNEPRFYVMVVLAIKCQEPVKGSRA